MSWYANARPDLHVSPRGVAALHTADDLEAPRSAAPGRPDPRSARRPLDVLQRRPAPPRSGARVPERTPRLDEPTARGGRLRLNDVERELAPQVGRPETKRAPSVLGRPFGSDATDRLRRRRRLERETVTGLRDGHG